MSIGSPDQSQLRSALLWSVEIEFHLQEEHQTQMELTGKIDRHWEQPLRLQKVGQISYEQFKYAAGRPSHARMVPASA